MKILEELIASQTVLKEILKRVPQEKEMLFQIEAGKLRKNENKHIYMSIVQGSEWNKCS